MPTPPTILIAKDTESFYKKGAQLFLETANAAVLERGRCSVALCGGSTPRKLFELLAQSYYRERMPWAKILLFWGDERFVPPTDAQSNYKMTQEALLSKVPIPASNIYRIPAEMQSPREAAKTYEQTLHLCFKSDGAWPKIDFSLLGVGEDGHTASLFPGTAALKEKERWVTANFVEKLSANRITLTFPVLNNARRTLFMCTGENKAAILKEVFREDPLGQGVASARYPVQLIQPAGDLMWLLDEAAASKLPSSVRFAAAHL